MCFPLLVYKKENIYSSIQINKRTFSKISILKIHRTYLWASVYNTEIYYQKVSNIFVSLISTNQSGLLVNPNKNSSFIKSWCGK